MNQLFNISEELRVKILEPPTKKVQAVLDTDTYNEIDDQFALAYALLSKEQIDLQAVYAAPFLNKRSTTAGDGMEKSYEEILRVLDRLNVKSDGYAYKGSNSFLTQKDKPVKSDAAEDLIKKALARKEEPLYVLSIGAPTNVASALLMEPKIIEKIVVVWLGGNQPTWKDADEFNCKQDIWSSQILYDSGVPFVNIPCYQVASLLGTTTMEIEHYLKGKNKIADYLCKIFVEYVNKYAENRYGFSKVIWDISTVAYLVNHKWIKTELIPSPILTDNLTYSIDNSRHLIRMGNIYDRDPIYADLFKKLENA